VIVHVCQREKFINSFIDLVCTHFNPEEHRFLVIGKATAFPITPRANVIEMASYTGNVLQMLHMLYRADRIFLHSLFDERMLQWLVLQPWLLKKVVWVMWGGDLYRYQSNQRSRRLATRLNEQIRAFAIPRFASYIGLRGDYKLAQRWYGVSRPLHEVFFYPSNLFRAECRRVATSGQDRTSIRILLGNSADPSNRHLELFERIAPHVDARCQLIVPLSYGDSDYRETVIQAGRKRFGQQLLPLTEFMALDEYFQLLSTIDIAMFNHQRQQAMSNLIQLLGFGAKVYLRDDVVTWDYFQDMDITLHATNGELTDLLSPLAEDTRTRNETVIGEQFSMSQWLVQMTGLFAGEAKDVHE
jgi:dTDP-N-acetylfucosamine:lipid II N-acetylfucosaminyltransferase